MAVWQFTIQLLPKSWAKDNKFNPASLYTAEGYHDVEYAWNDYQLREGFRDLLSQILPETRSRHKNLLVWGNDNEHDIQVGIEQGKAKYICIRLDLRQDLRLIIPKIIEITQTIECCFFFPEQEKITPPEVKELIAAIKTSRAFKYADDPIGL
ncbi:hypothetical protein [Kordiimonas sp. SCSIO 12610]|uniref:hypothetical protein n=1 Tax=Kordiimonas sp. SCSIO 12610 TaxID=2829597 RepID=UPI00210D731C|nr:hypothetical protein [Kordiimonas sp. SCSIO 12610]UTW56200.1 hypothetical protein KFF44_04690 [Kordiimonas sp. SCSIO 12610]